MRISIRPSVMLMPPDEPLPSMTTLPVPFGRRLMSLFEDETMSCVPTSRSPDRVGLLSPDRFVWTVTKL